MKKQILLIGAILMSLLFISCGKKESSTFKIGATVPAADILNNLKDDFLKEGITLEVIEFTDYVTPNIALAEKQIDANLFQHKPYLDFFKAEKKLDLTSLETVLISPIGIYSKKVKSLEDLKEGASIGIPNDTTNLVRALLVLEESGLIQLDKRNGLKLTLADITLNTKKLVFKELEAALLPRMLDELDATFINGNYAISSGLNPSTDSIYRESLDSPFANVVAVRTGDENSEIIKKAMKIIKSQKTKDFIETTYKGGILATF